MMKLYIKRTLVTVLISSCIIAQRNDAEIIDFQTTLQSFIQKKMKKHEVIGANVSLLIGNEVVLDKGFGFSDLENSIPTKPNTVYPIGSVSKVVTSTTILKLYSEGIIDIDKPYSHYVPDFTMKKHFSGPIDFTVRHLLAHYAGMPRLRAKSFLKKQYMPLDSLLTDSKEEYLIAPAGKVYQYSDWGVDLLALLVERVTKMPYEDYVMKHIFKPLGMKDSGFGPSSEIGYVNGKRTETYNFSFPGSDGVLSTTSDLMKLCQLYFIKGKKQSVSFLKPEIVMEAITEQYIDAPMAYNMRIGLMWEIRPYHGFKRIKKAGIHEPFYTYIFFIPEYDSAVIVCSNSNSSSKLHWDIWSKTFSFIAKKFKLKKTLPTIKRKSGKITLDDVQMEELAGTYNTNFGILNFEVNGDKLNVALSQDNRKGIATIHEENTLRVAVKMMGVKLNAMDIFWDKVEGELILGEQYKSGTRHISGSKIEVTQIPNIWKEALGNYKVINYSDIDYKTLDKVQLRINEFGVLEIKAHTSFPSEIDFQVGLSPKSDTIAIIPGYNFEFFGGETVELFKENGKFSLKLSGYKLQKISD
nr:serine hydrolase domain-containing protein [uncultured Allomuricauda sp.]